MINGEFEFLFMIECYVIYLHYFILSMTCQIGFIRVLSLLCDEVLIYLDHVVILHMRALHLVHKNVFLYGKIQDTSENQKCKLTSSS